MTTSVQRRRGSTTQHTAFTGLEGEITIDTSKDTAVVHDGSTVGGFPLAKETLENAKTTNLTGILGADTAADDTFLIYDASAAVMKKITRAELNNAIEVDALANVTITGGSINGTTVGASTASSGAFTSLTSSSTTTLNGTTIPASKTLLVSTDIGSTVQGYDADLAAFALKTAPTGDVIGSTDTQALSNKTITSSSLNSTPIGASSASTGNFTTLGATGVATFSAGTVSAPAITTTGDTNTGIFFPAADTIAFTEGGVEAMRIDSSGNAGLGVTPSAWSGRRVLQVGTNIALWGNVTGAGTLFLSNNTYFDGSNFRYLNTSGATFYAQGTDSSHTWNTAPSGTAGDAITFTERMRIDSSGNVGIGTSSPAFPLDIQCDTAAFGLRLRGRSDDISVLRFVNNAANTTLGQFDVRSTAFIINAVANVPMIFRTNDAERMRITNGGNVGIGTSTPNGGAVLTLAQGVQSYGIFLQGNSSSQSGNIRFVDSGVTAEQALISSLNGGGLIFNTGSSSTERMRINSTGAVSVGTTAAASRLTVQNPSSTDSATIDVRGNRNFVAETFGATSIIGVSDQTRNSHDFGAIRFEQNPATSDGGGALVRLFAGGASSSFAANAEFLRGDARGNTNGVDNIQFRTAGTERMRIDLAGNVGIGLNNPSSVLQLNRAGSIETAIKFTNGGAASGFVVGAGGSGAGLVYHIDSQPILFATANAERMRITSAGDLYVGASSALNTARLLVRTTFGSPTGTSVDYGTYIYSTGSVAADTGGVISLGGTYDNTGNGDTRWAAIAGLKENATNGAYGGYLAFYTRPNGAAPAERMRIDSSGNLLMGSITVPDAGADMSWRVRAADNYIVGSNCNTTANTPRYYFFNPNGLVGQIAVSGSATSYQTSSDYRLKDITGNLTGYKERIMSLQPKQGTWKADGSDFKGFVAHEFAAQYPNSVSGEKDAVDAEGKPQYQGMQAGGTETIADLVALVQEQQTLIENLTTRLNALEGK
jgi:hypothetical protein